MNKVIVICGPTASGKSAFALKLAQNYKELDPIIINADSMQLFKDIEIIAASPSKQDKEIIQHELYGILKAHDYCSVANYVKMAAETIKNALSAGRLPIVVGGTGMYINALMFGYSPIPEIDQDLRLKARKKLEEEGNNAFFQELVRLDPLITNKLNPGDSQRILRAYEVIKQSGKSILEYHAESPIEPLPNCRFKVTMLNPERKFLYKSCNDRFLHLLDKGALREVESLMQKKLKPEAQVLKALGVRELIDFHTGKLLLPEAIKLAQTKTRQYAKRQVTWFTHQIIEKQVIDYNGFEEFKAILNHINITPQ
ncbi:MAG: miaA [Rickettsiaceae bacterium]|jgi:tRNA dimethylallyltransferase|nr:miaA [Rickettsiaceae bacterium]